MKQEGAIKAKHLNESLFKGRQLTVMAKRKNIPGRGHRGQAGGRGQNPMMLMMQFARAMSRGGMRGGYRGARGSYRGRGGGQVPNAEQQAP
mmetsp:Transcript_22102/g.15782  ORF Transcript_22102/g.15782 Transcript_22102/m.15782 type:complete len:91 (-) Transcript_22102:243-515(-)